LLGVCPDLLLKLLKLNIIEVGTKSPWYPRLVLLTSCPLKKNIMELDGGQYEKFVVRIDQIAFHLGNGAGSNTDMSGQIALRQPPVGCAIPSAGFPHRFG